MGSARGAPVGNSMILVMPVSPILHCGSLGARGPGQGPNAETQMTTIIDCFARPRLPSAMPAVKQRPGNRDYGLRTERHGDTKESRICAHARDTRDCRSYRRRRFFCPGSMMYGATIELMYAISDQRDTSPSWSRAIMLRLSPALTV